MSPEEMKAEIERLQKELDVSREREGMNRYYEVCQGLDRLGVPVVMPYPLRNTERAGAKGQRYSRTVAMTLSLEQLEYLISKAEEEHQGQQGVFNGGTFTNHNKEN